MQVVTMNGTLHMSSESREDARTLERVVAEHEVSGCGRHPETGELLHVSIGLNRWIPVTERLPDDDVIVLAYAPKASEPIWPAYLSDEGEVQSHWRWAEGAMVGCDVTHWQPFPEPPEAEEA